MDLASLKEIMETLNQMGESAKDAFMWWMVIKAAPTILFGGAWTVIAAVAIKSAHAIFCNNLASERIRRAAGVGYRWNSEDLESFLRGLESNKDA